MFDLCVDFVDLYTRGYTKPFPKKKRSLVASKTKQNKKTGRNPPENAAGAEGFRKRAWQVEQAILSTGDSICKDSRQGLSLDSLIPRSERQKLQFV